MIKETIGTGRTVEAAIADGAARLGVETSRVQYEVIEAPQRGFLGFGEAPAKVKVYYEIGPEQTAVDYVNGIMEAMGISGITADVSRELNSDGGKIIKMKGEEAGILIGRHGETLDALQYLSNLALNNKIEQTGEECEKITLDIEGYRMRREETLKNLARRTADKVKKYRKNITLEPMTPYERRIIHSALQGDRRVMTASIGADENRRVVVHYVPKAAPKKEEAAAQTVKEEENE